MSVAVALPSVDPHVYLCGATSDCVAYSHSFVYVCGASFEFVAVAVSSQSTEPMYGFPVNMSSYVVGRGLANFSPDTLYTCIQIVGAARASAGRC